MPVNSGCKRATARRFQKVRLDLVNRGSDMAICLDVGSRSPSDICIYPDIDLRADRDDYSHEHGQPYPRPE
jgi:uncharacterized cupin superfamily protein